MNDAQQKYLQEQRRTTTKGINRIQNYYSTRSIGLVETGNYIGWAFDESGTTVSQKMILRKQ